MGEPQPGFTTSMVTKQTHGVAAAASANFPHGLPGRGGGDEWSMPHYWSDGV